jgi:site-specific recombinase XerD
LLVLCVPSYDIHFKNEVIWNKKRELNALIEECVAYLQENGFSENRIADYKGWWKKGVENYMKEHSLQLYDTEIGDSYVRSLTDPTSYRYEKMRRSIGILSPFLETGEVAKKTAPKIRHELPGEIGQLAEEFLTAKKELRVAEQTIINRRVLSQFIKSLQIKGVYCVEDIREDDVLAFISSTQNLTVQRMYVIRLFCRHLYQKGHTKYDLEYIIGRSPARSTEKLPSVYSAEEVKVIEKHIDRGRNGGKRNYAMFLLASRIGLRVSDIVNLKFENIDWDSNTINLEQIKTKKCIELPLFADIGEAIIDYLQYERAISKHKEVFLSMTPPYEKLSRQTVTSIIQRIIKDTGIDISKRKFGMHAMRHSLAGQLLQNDTPLPIISEVLGHTSSQATMNYLRIDIEKRIQCSLSVLPVPETFYNQKGGIFYE